MSDLIGVTNSAPMVGIMATTINWGTPGNQTSASANVYSATVFTQIKKSHQAEVSTTKDNSNEVLAIRRTNKTVSLSFSAKPVAATVVSAMAICAALPYKMDVVSIACASDSQLAGIAYVDTADASFTPDGDAVIDFTVTKYPVTLVAMS